MSISLSAPASAAECAQEEASIVLDHLTANDAKAIGQSVLELAPQWFPGRPVAVQVELDSHPLFAHFMDGTGPGNVDWIGKKKNVTRKFGRSSWAVRLEFLERNADFQKETGLDPELFRAEGGAVPLVVGDKGRVGTITVSGLHGWEDHVLAVGGLRRWIAKGKGRDAASKAAGAKKILLVLGGAWHDFEGFAATMVPVLTAAGYQVEATYDHTSLERLDELAPNVVMIYTSLGNASDGKRTGKDFTPEQAAALSRWVERGNALVGIHSASVADKSSTTYHQLIGGRFAHHPPQCEFIVTPRHDPHPITAGIRAFTVHDELYMHDNMGDGEVLAVTVGEKMHPMLWTRRHGSGAVAYFAPGHDAKAWNVPEFRTITTRCVEWALASRDA